MTKHCDTCTCETPAERQARLEKADRERREREFVARWSVLTDSDLAWAKARLEGAS